MQLTSLLGNRQWLDGGAMFGNAPRALWSRWCPPDERGRIELACRALLLEHAGRRVLFEVGIGAFFDPKLRDRYGVDQEGHVLLESLREVGLGPSDIDVVVLSHLHFDHAGGLLSAWREGARSELLFSNARFVVSAGAWERARAPHSRDRASFLPELVDLLERSGRLELVSGPHAESLGADFELHFTDGHTPSMAHAWIRGAQGNLFFCADLIPGVPWVHLPVTMGYDRYPEHLIDEKARLYPLFEEQNTWLYFTHDRATAMCRVARRDDGRYEAKELQSDLRGFVL